MVRRFFEKIILGIRRIFKRVITKLFRRPLTTGEINSQFLKTASKLTFDGTVEIHRGGLRLMNQLLADSDKVVYILTVNTRRRKKIVLEDWFRIYGNKRKW